MPNEHPMMSREEYHRRFPDDPTGPVERLTPDEEVLVNALRSVVGGALSPLGLYHLTGLLRIIERLSGDGTPPTDTEVERVAKAIWNAQYTHLDAETLFGDPCNPYWVEAANEARAQARAAIEALRGRAEPAEGERRTEALLDRIETLLTDAENEAMRWPTSMAEYRHFALPKIVEARKVAARLGAALRVPGVEDQR